MTTAPEVDALREQWSRLLAYTQNLTPKQLNLRTPCRGWRVRDIVAHVASLTLPLTPVLEAVHRGKSTIDFAYDPHLQSQRNQQGVQAHRNRPDLLAFHRARATSTLTLFDVLARENKLDTVIHYLATVTVRAMAALIAVDLAVHLWDITSAVGRPVEPDVEILEGAMPVLFEQVLPALFQPERAVKLTITYAVTLRDVWNGTWRFLIDDGIVVVERGPVPGRQVQLTSTLATFLLLSFGRINRVSSVMRGRLQVRGNPRLAMRFNALFVQF
jgi:uncharacterized protein (TIGR03083 family)